MDTEGMIAQAMMRLVRQHAFDKITTQMILDEAGVSRSTFYRHFQDKYDLVNRYYQAHIHQIYKEHPRWKDCMVEIYRFLGQNRLYFKKAMEMDGPHTFWDFFYHFSYDYAEQCYLRRTGLAALPDKERVTAEFFIMGQVYIVKRWLATGAGVPPEDMGEWAYELTPEPFRQTLDPAEGEEFPHP